MVERSADGRDEGLHEAAGGDGRRGAGRWLGILLGAVGAAGLVLLALFVWGPFAPQTPPAGAPPADNTVPVTTLPQAPTSAVPSDLPVASATTLTQEPEPGQSGGGVPVALSRWSWVPELGAFSAAGYIAQAESGGECTLTATDGATTVQGSAPAEASAATTNCVVNLPVDAAPGQWRLTLSYRGPSGSGASETVVVTVP